MPFGRVRKDRVAGRAIPVVAATGGGVFWIIEDPGRASVVAVMGLGSLFPTGWRSDHG